MPLASKLCISKRNVILYIHSVLFLLEIDILTLFIIFIKCKFEFSQNYIVRNNKNSDCNYHQSKENNIELTLFYQYTSVGL